MGQLRLYDPELETSEERSREWFVDGGEKQRGNVAARWFPTRPSEVVDL
jgi:hypothetical protein